MRARLHVLETREAAVRGAVGVEEQAPSTVIDELHESIRTLSSLIFLEGSFFLCAFSKQSYVPHNLLLR